MPIGPAVPLYTDHHHDHVRNISTKTVSSPLPLMSSPAAYEWHRTVDSTHYTISTSPTHLSHHFVNHAFAQPAMFWATPLSPADLAATLAHSLTLGLYIRTAGPSLPAAATGSSPSSPRTPSPTVAAAADDADAEGARDEAEPTLTQIGMARLVTDRVTSAYLTDVYVDPAHGGRGLGRWLVQCVRAVVDDMPALRRVLLMAEVGEGRERGRAIRFYEKVLGCKVFEQGRVVVMSRARMDEMAGGETDVEGVRGGQE